jgi:hypothetical protein
MFFNLQMSAYIKQLKNLDNIYPGYLSSECLCIALDICISFTFPC